MNWYLKVIKQYADFNGRARRKEYWMYTLISTLISIVLSIIDTALGFQIGVIGILYSLFVFIPGIAVSVRRLHDVNKSGWMLLLIFLPIIGWIWLLVLNATEGTIGENKFGLDPKQETIEA